MMKVYSVRDSKAESFGSPIVCVSQGIALRMFREACAQPASELAKYASDYSLYEVGTWDVNEGLLSGHKFPVEIMTASAVVTALEAERSVKESKLSLAEVVSKESQVKEVA